jgi:Reverse transcriptase (RNA-dependent DNA polymerase)
LLKTIYGTKQAAKIFWLFILGIFKSFGFKYNRVDPCLYYKWSDDGLVMWSSWVDDMSCVGQDKLVLSEMKKLTGRFKCDDTGEMKEYVEFKVAHDKMKQWMRFTQSISDFA